MKVHVSHCIKLLKDPVLGKGCQKRKFISDISQFALLYTQALFSECGL